MHPMARRLWLLAWLSLLGLLTLYFHGREQPSVTASGDLLLRPMPAAIIVWRVPSTTSRCNCCWTQEQPG
jgi:hypothetical protein